MKNSIKNYMMEFEKFLKHSKNKIMMNFRKNILFEPHPFFQVYLFPTHSLYIVKIEVFIPKISTFFLSSS